MLSAARRSLKSCKQHVRSVTGRHFWLRYATLAGYRSLCAGASAITGRTTSGTVHAENDVDSSVRHVTTIMNHYRASSGLERFHGRLAEVGPGDSCGIGLMFLAHGCAQADLVDRFFSQRDRQHQQAINRAIVQQYPGLESLLRNGDFSEASFRNLTRHYGRSAAAETFFKRNQGYDFIVSCAVMEHVYDPLQAVSAMASALNPEGMMLHQVDCRDHGQFSGHFHELKFLELPPGMYSPLKWGGGPNRVRLSSYVDVLRRERLDFNVYVSRLAGIDEDLAPHMTIDQVPKPFLDASRDFVSQVRGRFAQPFRDMPDEDLMVTGFMLAAQRRA